MSHNETHASASEEGGSVWEGDSMIRRNMMRYVIAAVVAAFILLCTSFVSIMHSTRSAMSAMSHDLAKPLADRHNSETLAEQAATVVTTTATQEPSTTDTSTKVQATADAVPSGGQKAVDTEVVVNGQQIPVPATGGTVETEVPTSSGGSTQVQISVDSRTSGSSETSSSSELEMTSSSTSTKEVRIEKSD